MIRLDLHSTTGKSNYVFQEHERLSNFAIIAIPNTVRQWHSQEFVLGGVGWCSLDLPNPPCLYHCYKTLLLYRKKTKTMLCIRTMQHPGSLCYWKWKERCPKQSCLFWVICIILDIQFKIGHIIQPAYRQLLIFGSVTKV